MLWLDLIDIIYLVLGVMLGYIICCTVNKDILQDQCDDCEYRKFIEEVLIDEEKKVMGIPKR